MRPLIPFIVLVLFLTIGLPIISDHMGRANIDLPIVKPPTPSIEQLLIEQPPQGLGDGFFTSPKKTPSSAATAKIYASIKDQPTYWRGSSFFAKLDGCDEILLITCKHCVEDISSGYAVDTLGQAYHFKQVYLMPDRDMAVIRTSPEPKGHACLKICPDIWSIKKPQTFISLGYLDHNNVPKLVCHEGTLEKISTQYFNVFTSFVSGNSGGPILLKNTSTVVGIASHGNDDKPETARIAQRLDNAKYASLTLLKAPSAQKTPDQTFLTQMQACDNIIAQNRHKIRQSQTIAATPQTPPSTQTQQPESPSHLTSTWNTNPNPQTQTKTQAPPQDQPPTWSEIAGKSRDAFATIIAGPFIIIDGIQTIALPKTKPISHCLVEALGADPKDCFKN